MTGLQYRDSFAYFGLNQVQAAKFFGVSERTSRYWAAGGPPAIVHMLLHVMIARGITVEQVNYLIGRNPL